MASRVGLLFFIDFVMMQRSKISTLIAHTQYSRVTEGYKEGGRQLKCVRVKKEWWVEVHVKYIFRRNSLSFVPALAARTVQ